MQRGFTLIEMSIVLVIIGLVVGGVLVGRDLIKAAELRSIISDNEKIVTALNVFKNKYGCVAGDCANASNFFAGTVNGNGNDIIQWGSGFMPNAEGPNVWNHLANAGLIAGAYPAVTNLGVLTTSNFYPGPNKGSGYMFKRCVASGTYCYTGWEGARMSSSTRPDGTQILVFGRIKTTDLRMFDSALTSLEAKSIDIKMDDGMPNTGKIGVLDFAWCMTDYNDPATDYARLTWTTQQCLLVNVIN